MTASIEHIVFVLVMIFLAVAIFMGAAKNLKKMCRPYGTDMSFPTLSKRQRELNEAFEKMVKEGNLPKKRRSPASKSVKSSKKDSHMAQEKARYAKAYQPWTKDEDESLKRMYANGESMAALKLVFQRGEGAINSRIRKICK